MEVDDIFVGLTFYFENNKSSFDKNSAIGQRKMKYATENL